MCFLNSLNKHGLSVVPPLILQAVKCHANSKNKYVKVNPIAIYNTLSIPVVAVIIVVNKVRGCLLFVLQICRYFLRYIVIPLKQNL